MSFEPERLATSIEFSMNLGLFYTAWPVAEASIDYAIGKFLRLKHAETHLLTAGMEHGRKSNLLRQLIARSDHPNKEALLKALKIMQNESLRNVFAHSYIHSTDKIVTFIERSRGGQYVAKKHSFTIEEFESHVSKFCTAAGDFHEALDVDDPEFVVFQAAALNVKNKS